VKDQADRIMNFHVPGTPAAIRAAVEVWMDGI